jgi:hypothetical protein
MLALAGLLLIGGAGCSMIHDDTSASSADRVTVTASTDSLVITNRTEAPIWTFVAGQQALTTMLWAPRLDGAGIAPGESERLALADIPKGPDEQEVIVYWWHAVEENEEQVPGDTQSIAVAL